MERKTYGGKENLKIAGKGKLRKNFFDFYVRIKDEDKAYIVSANYVAKSKLIEGDVLEVVENTATEKTFFVQKQLVARKHEELMIQVDYERKLAHAIDSNNRLHPVVWQGVEFNRIQDGDMEKVAFNPEIEDTWAVIVK